jgi:hypothetical protein
MKSKIIYVFWGIVFLLTGIGVLVGIFDFNHLSIQEEVLYLSSAALAFIITYFLDGIKKWGWLLPAFVCAGLAVDLSSELNRTFLSQPNGVPIMIGLALWFFIGFLINRTRWGLLIPAYILIIASVETVVNTLIVPSILHDENNMSFLLVYSSGAGMMFLLAFPFFVVYFISKKSWWALIPAGSLTSLGLAIALNFLIQDKQNTHVGIFTGVLLLGLAITFGILWLQRKSQPTDWAKYPAAGLFILAILAFILGNGWNTLSDQTKAIVFTVASAAFFISYLVNGLRKWGWLFPSLFCAAMALTMWMAINNMEDSPLMSIAILASLAIPFFVGYACEPHHKALLIPAFILTVVMILTLTSDSDYEGSFVMFMFALPFFVVYFLSEKSWWAFIPAGVFATIGMVSLVEELLPHKEYASLPNTMHWGVYNWVLFLGFAITFGVPWLRHKTEATDWTKYPALGFLAIAIISFALGERFQEYWLSSIMIVIGGMFLFAIVNKKMPLASHGAPQIKA